jgi:hypothetical protein
LTITYSFYGCPNASIPNINQVQGLKSFSWQEIMTTEIIFHQGGDFPLPGTFPKKACTLVSKVLMCALAITDFSLKNISVAVFDH